jgi:hypothetical protein
MVSDIAIIKLWSQAIGAGVGTLLDPSDSLSAWYGKDGPQNYSFWDDKEFQAPTARIDREIDPAKRLQLVHQAEAINPAPISASFDVVRFDTVWLEKS